MLTKVRRGVADVATSRKRVELQVSTLEQQAAKLASQRERGARRGPRGPGRRGRSREAGVQEQLSDLRRQHLSLTGEEERLTAASQRLQAKVEAFRIRKETLKARYTAAEAVPERPRGHRRPRRGHERSGGDDTETDSGPISPGLGRGGRALREIRDLALPLPRRRRARRRRRHDVPPGMMELRPGAPDYPRAGVLFVVEPRTRRSWWPTSKIRADRLRMATGSDTGSRQPAWPRRSRRPGGSARLLPRRSSPMTRSRFSTSSSPARKPRSRSGRALVARSRAHTLAEARQRMRLTQAQVAAA